MATTVNAPTTSAIPSLTAEITEALADADMVIKRLALYDSAEAKGRHTDSGMSILRYALERYITSNIEVPAKYTLKVEATDDAVILTGTNKSPRRAKTDTFTQEVAYPLWLSDFFSDDEAFDLLMPENKTSLAEVIEILREYIDESEANADADAEAEDELVQGEDDEDEEDDDEEEEDDEEPEEDAEEESEDEDDEEYDDDEDEDDEEDDEPVAVGDNCQPDAYGVCTNTIHQLGGEHNS